MNENRQSIFISGEKELTMVFKLIQASEKNWQRIHGYKLLPLILTGEKFINGLRQAI
jgi:hypothetical protein